ncbi:hypothetical protein AB0L62_33150 [Nocardia asteroides]|uniref:hypothetical protein n=1 Tax=Nocardia asteroides TaxID=1824 RepID=UPI003446862A
MFTFTDTNNAAHAGGPAAEDEIVRDTSRALGQIMAVARSWIAQHRGRVGAKGVPKLSRKERRELAESIRVQVGEQKIAATWFTKRVNDYHAEVVAAGLRAQQPGFTEQDARLDAQRLAGIRYSIESTLHETESLPLERRGQVAIALSTADTNPSQPYGAIFKTMTPEQERTARVAAVQSEQWVTSRREHNERLVTEQRVQAAKLAEARREARPPRSWDELDQTQRESVQVLRSAHLGVDRAGVPLEPRAAAVAQDDAAKAARAAGLTQREIGEQIDYMAEYTEYTGTYGAEGRGQVVNHYPYRSQAMAETRRELGRDKKLGDQRVWAEIKARPNGQMASLDPEKQSAFGSRDEVTASVARWERAPQELLWQAGEPTEVAIARIEPGTGKVLASEVATLHSEQAAFDFAHRSVTAAGSDVARMRVEITDPARPETPRYSDYGVPKTLGATLADLRVVSREQQLHESDRRQQHYAEEFASLNQRHGLSIEHNADLTEQNAELTRRLTAMTAERDQAVAEKTQLRQERDEAVAKVIERTAPGQRLGSPQRQATQARAKSARPDQAQKDLADIMATANGAGALNGVLQRLGVSAETRGRVTEAAYRLDQSSVRSGRGRTDQPAAASSTPSTESATESAPEHAAATVTESEPAVPETGGVSAMPSALAAYTGSSVASSMQRQEREGMER